METEIRPNRRMNRPAALLLLLTAIVYFPYSINRAVIDYDEGYYSQAALHMAQSGDWVTPYVNGVRFLEKPPLMYWLTAGSFCVFGANEFALRLPTTFAVIALVWIVMLTAGRVCGAQAAFISGLCTSTAAGTYLFTRETLHDVWLVLFVTLAIYAFLEWYLDPEHGRPYAILFYAALAGAVMTKSLVGIAFPTGIAVVFFLLEKELPKWRALHIVPGVLLFLALTVPWHWLAAIRDPGFLYSFFVNEQFLRFLGRHDPPVLWSLPLLVFWALILIWFFPWTAFLPAAIDAARKPDDRRQRALAKLVLAWLIVVLGFFSISARLEHYSFPIIPALALLVGMALSRDGHGRTVMWAFRALAILGIFALVAGAGVGLWFAAGRAGIPVSNGARIGIVNETDFSVLADMPAVILKDLLKPAVLTILALAAGFFAALRFEIRGRRMAAICSIAASMMIVCGMIQWSLVICEDLISSKKLALAVAREVRPGDRLVVIGDYESANSLNFYEPLGIEVYQGVAYALIPGLKYHDAPRVVLTQREFETAWHSENRIFAIASRDQARELKLGGAELMRVLDRVLLSNK